MTASPGFIELLKDLLAPVGTITVKRMFGGAGIYIDGVVHRHRRQGRALLQD